MRYISPSELRRPPRLGRSLVIDLNKRVRSRRLYFRSGKEANPSNSMIESLPDELLMEILLRLSADEIYDNARLVCRRWCHLIHSDAFVSAHLHRITSGLILRPHTWCSPVLMTATTQGRVEISKLRRWKFYFPVTSSCNGLALCLICGGDRGTGGVTPIILNPATKRAFNLPKFPIRGHRQINTAGMAYAAASMAYKVFASYRVIKSGVQHFVMLAVGVDKTWRHVALEELSLEARSLIICHSTPLITGSFLHWVSKTRVLSLNVETETFTLTPTPLMFPQQRYSYLSTGEYLSLFLSCGDWSWDVWEMKPETWEWKKALPNIDLEAHKCKIQQFSSQKDDVLRPVGWVRYPEVLAFFFNGTSRYSIIYNLGTEAIESVELSSTTVYHSVAQQHRSSLVWLERC